MTASVMIFADLHDGKRAWKRETRTNSLTSGPRSPTKMENSGPRSSLRAGQRKFWGNEGGKPADDQQDRHPKPS